MGGIVLHTSQEYSWTRKVCDPKISMGGGGDVGSSQKQINPTAIFPSSEFCLQLFPGWILLST